MIVDALFLNEKSAFRKIALLITIPCAILPIIMAASLLMTNNDAPQLFSGDKWLALPVYLFYVAGLYFSYRLHRKLWPFTLFIIHILFLLAVQEGLWKTGMPYLAIFSILITSVVNQYLRTGSPACDDNCYR